MVHICMILSGMANGNVLNITFVVDKSAITQVTGWGVPFRGNVRYGCCNSYAAEQ